MNIKFILGVATGVGITYFLTSSKGQTALKSLGDTLTGFLDTVAEKYEDKLEEGAEKLKSVTHTLADTERMPI